MRRDMNLVREILLAIEKAESGFAPPDIQVQGYSEEIIGYHVYIMMEGGLLKGADVTVRGGKSPQAVPGRLTWAGHEFIDAARDSTRWNRALSLVGEKAGSVTISVLTELLASLMKSALGLP